MISVSEKRMKNCIVKIIDNVFEKNDEGELFPLTNRSCFVTYWRIQGGYLGQCPQRPKAVYFYLFLLSSRDHRALIYGMAPSVSPTADNHGHG